MALGGGHAAAIQPLVSGLLPVAPGLRDVPTTGGLRGGHLPSARGLLLPSMHGPLLHS